MTNRAHALSQKNIENSPTINIEGVSPPMYQLKKGQELGVRVYYFGS